MEMLYAYLASAINVDGRITIERIQGQQGRMGLHTTRPRSNCQTSSPTLPDWLQATFPARRLEYAAEIESKHPDTCGKP
jgi:hypothetical protein